MARAGITYRFEEKLAPYVAAVRHTGLETAPLHPDGSPSLEGLDGLVIGGGTDLNPSLYGQERHPANEEPDDARDTMEIQLLREALARDLPVLAICRGLQLFNVALGGTLIQHLDSADRHRQRGVTNVHHIQPVPGTRLACVLVEESFHVNSRHHQAVDQPAPGLIVSAWSDDELIEGLELPGKRFAVAVQWHPEDRVPSHAPDTRLFEAFAAAVRSR